MNTRTLPLGLLLCLQAMLAANPLAWSADSSRVYYLSPRGNLVWSEPDSGKSGVLFDPPEAEAGQRLVVQPDFALASKPGRVALRGTMGRFTGLWLHETDGRLWTPLKVPFADVRTPPQNLCWSSDGSQLAFLADVADRAGPNAPPRRTSPADRRALLPNLTQPAVVAALTRPVDPWLLDATLGGRPQRLVLPQARSLPLPGETTGKPVFGPLLDLDSDLVFAPDGTSLVFDALLVAPDGPVRALWQLRLADRALVLLHVAASADARYLGLTANAATGRLTWYDGEALLSLLPGETPARMGKLRFGSGALALDQQRVAIEIPSAMAWSPDGQWLAILAGHEIVLLGADQLTVKSLTREAAPARRPATP